MNPGDVVYIRATYGGVDERDIPVFNDLDGGYVITKDDLVVALVLTYAKLVPMPTSPAERTMTAAADRVYNVVMSDEAQ